MNTLLRILSCLILTVSLGLFGLQAGANTGRSAGVMTIVICASAGAESITIDANGNPVEQSPECCDCVSCNAPSTHLNAGFVQPHLYRAQHATLEFTAKDQIKPLVNLSLVQARGPPSMIWHKGACAVPGCGLVCKDAAA